MDEQVDIESVGAHHLLCNGYVLLRSGMARRSEREHRVVEDDARCIGGTQHCDSGEGLHRTPQSDQAIGIAERTDERATSADCGDIAAVHRLDDLSAMQFGDDRWRTARPNGRTDTHPLTHVLMQVRGSDRPP